MQLPPRPSDLEAAARAVLDPALYGYLAGGAGDEVTLAEATAAWRAWAPRTRVLAGLESVDLSARFAGAGRSSPVAVAPMAGQQGVHPSGEIGLARAAAAQGVPYALSTRASVSATQLAEGVPGGRHWLQLYVLRDRAVSADLVAEAVACGFEAVLLTVDLPVLGWRDREVEIAFPLPGGPYVGAGVPQDPTLVWDDVAELVATAGVPVLVKGVLEVPDAVLAAEAGAAGVVVSTHGGRQLDTCVPSAVALPEVVAAVGDRCEVLVDGGLRRGTDVLAALALGAAGVLVGRPCLWGLAVGGPDGAEAVLAQLHEELRIAMTLTGCASVADLGPSVLRRATWR